MNSHQEVFRSKTDNSASTIPNVRLSPNVGFIDIHLHIPSGEATLLYYLLKEHSSTLQEEAAIDLAAGDIEDYCDTVDRIEVMADLMQEILNGIDFRLCDVIAAFDEFAYKKQEEKDRKIQRMTKLIAEGRARQRAIDEEQKREADRTHRGPGAERQTNPPQNEGGQGDAQ